MKGSNRPALVGQRLQEQLRRHTPAAGQAAVVRQHDGPAALHPTLERTLHRQQQWCQQRQRAYCAHRGRPAGGRPAPAADVER